jgi:hypothetical protein
MRLSRAARNLARDVRKEIQRGKTDPNRLKKLSAVNQLLEFTVTEPKLMITRPPLIGRPKLVAG